MSSTLKAELNCRTIGPNRSTDAAVEVLSNVTDVHFVTFWVSCGPVELGLLRLVNVDGVVLLCCAVELGSFTGKV